MVIVASASPTMISRIGNTVSMPSVFISLIYINIFFLVRARKWSQNTYSSASSEIVYSSSFDSALVLELFISEF